jgi:uncharacterized protein involved in exopolysaccharide biosynthesis
MKRYIQTFLRHKVLLIAPIVVALVAGLGLVMKQPKKFVATGTLWADAPVPNDSTVFSGGSDGGPAAQQQAVLAELLHTHDFLSKVANRVASPAGGPSHPVTVSDAKLASMEKTISVSTIGPQVLSVTAHGATPTETAGTANAVIQEFMSEMSATQQARARELADYYKQQADAAGKAITASQSQLASYLQSHPGASNDPTAAQLAGTVGVAQQQYSQAQDNYSKASLALSHASDSSQLRVIDKPVAPSAPASSKKKIVFAGIGGLVAGSVISLLILMVLVATDTSARDEGDIENQLGLDVVGSVKQFPGHRRDTGKAS